MKSNYLFILIIAIAMLVLPACDQPQTGTEKITDSVDDALDRRPGEKARDAAEDAADKAKDVGEDAVDKAKDVGEDIKESAEDATGY